MERVLGLDLSLNSTGWAKVTPERIDFGRITPVKLTGHQRMSFNIEAIWDLCEDVTLTVVEAPVAHAPGRGDSVIEQHGLSWTIRQMMWDNQIPYAMILPTQLKLYATGTGSGDKFVVLAAAIRRFGGVPVNQSDEADALWLAAMGADHLGFAPVQMPQPNRKALAKVQWPVPGPERPAAAVE